MTKAVATLLVAFTTAICCGDEPLSPKMVQLGKPILVENFETDGATFDHWPSTNKRWSADSGVLRGLPSTQEYRENQGRAHNGEAPNLFVSFGSLEKPVPNACFSIRFKYLKAEDDVEPKGKVGFAGKSTCLILDSAGSRIGTLDVAYDSDEAMRFEHDRWYNCLFEIYDNEVLVQVEGGPTFYGNDETISIKDKAERAHRIFISGPKEGTVLIDHIKAWPATRLKEEWEKDRQPLLAAYAPQKIERKKKRKKK